MLKLRKKGLKWVYPRVGVADLRRRLEYLEFENEFILEFLRKYLITNGKVNREVNIPNMVEAHNPTIFLYSQLIGNHGRIVK